MRALKPVPLGTDFVKLWTASAVSNLGDGVTMVAGPLLVASLTDDPSLIAGAAFVQTLPWVLFAVLSGAFVDRYDRRRLIIAVNLFRGLVLGLLAVLVSTGHASVPLVYAAFFLSATGETLADTAAGALIPDVVPEERLATANSRLYATFTIGNQFVAKPLGAWLFVVAVALPSGFDALTFLVAAALIAAIRPGAARQAQGAVHPSIGHDIREGVTWLWRHDLLRTLAVSMGIANIGFSAAFAVFVLYSQQRLGLSEIGYGLLLTAFAVGGLLGNVLIRPLWTRFGAVRLLRAGLLIEVLTHLTLATTHQPLVAATIITVFGAHTTVWGVIATTRRQEAVPDRLRGRVGGVYALFDATGTAVGLLVGGALAQTLGLTAPFWLATALTALVAVMAWHPLRQAAG
ncbi:MFS transporter [Acrocarpospora macrocephala]|uniref:MFS transporter n=1 Tax=Acrocarpospora macrocephala TaxID=150177 RepID=A0A5M3WFR1_9ACTN|nr:MFS transporter [Acrocarpospora macrocephala]GES07110.1 MFS transporter [Acrocarpospora macrocephala]